MLVRMGRKGNPPTLLVRMLAGTATLENSMEVPQKVENLPYDPAITLLGIYPKDTNVIRRGLCTRMFIAAMSTIAKLWKDPRCPSTDEWIKKMWYIQWNTMQPSRETKSGHLQRRGWNWRVLC